ncbi:MAG TPA: universal stress protein [Streptosporangiaceae bacterium]|jgi:nucleotide-binding universal stress UspA family protein|nr:universal stress protein [Streptosporangiaceae bacterium]
MSADAPAVSEAQQVVGFDGSAPAVRALDAAVRLLTVRPGRIRVVWVAHLASMVELSADAVAIVESDFDKVAEEFRTAAAEHLGDSGVSWDFAWRQGLIAPELIKAAESIQADSPDDVVAIVVGSSSSPMHRVVGSVAVNLARHAPVPVIIVP